MLLLGGPRIMGMYVDLVFQSSLHGREVTSLKYLATWPSLTGKYREWLTSGYLFFICFIFVYTFYVSF